MKAAAIRPAMRCVERLRQLGLSVVMHASGREGLGSLKSQFRRADASGARHALIFGADELARGELSVKPLRDAAAAQRSRPLADVAQWAHELRNA